MGNKSKKVNLKPFNPNKPKMYKSNEFEEAYTVELKLDSTPDDVWERIFNNEYKASLYMMKRPVSVSGNKLRVVTSTHDNLKDEMEWIKELVSATNQRCEQYDREVEQREKQKRAKEEENKRKIRDKLK